MSEQTNFLIGKLLDASAQRDVVHIAVLPVIAGEDLPPSAPIAFVGSGMALVRASEKAIGIVDPFLREPVKKGDRFFMFLLPNTITSLRHQWTHPNIDDRYGIGVKSESEKWLRDFAHEVDADYDEMMIVAATHAADSGSQFGDYLCEGGKWEGQSTPAEFWTHYEAVTGKKPNTKYGLPGIFSCSC